MAGMRGKATGAHRAYADVIRASEGAAARHSAVAKGLRVETQVVHKSVAILLEWRKGCVGEVPHGRSLGGGTSPLSEDDKQ